MDNDRVYKINGETVSQTINTGQGVIVFHAENIRNQRTGIHAKLYVVLYANSQSRILDYSVFNIERASERSRFAGSIYKQFGNIFRETYPEVRFRDDFNEFCRGLFDASMSIYKPDELEGSMTRKPRNFILNPYVIEGAGTIIYAPPGKGKSYLAFLMAILIDSGHTGFWPVKQKKVFFINLERDKELVRQRIGSINRALGLTATRPILTLSARGRTLASIKDACERAVNDSKAEVTILDSISRTGHGTLVEDEVANSVIDSLSRICPTWLAIAHTSKSDETRIFGSTMFEAGIDVGVQIIAEQYEQKMGVGLIIRKGNDIKKPTKKDILAITFDDIGLTGIRWAGEGEFTQIEGVDSISDFEKVKLHLLSVGKDYVRNIAESTGVDPSNVSKILYGRNKVFQIIRDEGKGKAKYWAVIDDKN